MTSTLDRSADSVVILDFETTGLSPDMGDRAIEIGAVRLEQGKVTGTFQQLMNPGQRISGFIENFTGITNAMLQNAAPCAEVMHAFTDFLGDANLVAHNASFDQRFLDTELSHIQRSYSGTFACSLLIARRLYQEAPNHKLGTLLKYRHIAADGAFHRALFDAEMTAKLWLDMLNHLETDYALTQVNFSLLQKLAKTPKKSMAAFLRKQSLSAC